MSTDKKPIQLPISKQQTCSGENISSSSHICNSEKEYEDIIYITGSNCFWLLDKKSEKLINQAVSTFKKKVFSVTTGGDMLPKLAEEGCELFISISPATFLNDQDKSRWEELEAYRKKTRDKMDENYKKIVMSDEENHRKRLPTICHPLDKKLLKEADKMYSQQAELNILTEKGFKNAEVLGYLVDRQHHEIFDPRQKKIKESLDCYIKNSELFTEKTKTPSDKIAEAQSYLNSLSEVNKKILIHSPDLDNEITKLTLQLDELKSGFKALMLSISELAGLGIAVPEYALAGINDTQGGADAYSMWFTYLAEKEKFKKDMDKQLSALKVGTDRGVMPPSEAFRNLIEKMAKQQEKADDLYQKALVSCKNHKPQMLLLWDPKGYKTPQIKCIANPSYPLREFVSTKAPDGKKQVRRDYFSLKDIPRVVKKTQTKFPYNVTKIDGDPELEEMLKPYGIQKLPLQRRWFNERGFFVPSEFYKDTIYNKNINNRIKIKKLESNKSVWEKNITRFLFRDIVQQIFSPVDESSSGVFLRMVSDGIKTTTLKTETTHSNDAGHLDANKKSTIKEKKTYINIASQTDFTLLRGEFEIINHTFPEEPKAYFLPITYKIRDTNNKELRVMKNYDLGKWSFHAIVKCFGFIGATIKLSTSLYGETPILVPSDKTTQQTNNTTRVAGAAIEGFVGAQIGASFTGELLWQPPESIKNQLSPAIKLPTAIGTINLVAMAAIGWSMKLPLEIKYSDGNFTINMKPTFWGGMGFNLAMSSEVNVAGIFMLIELFQDMLKEADYHRIDSFDTETFDVLSNYTLVLLLIMPWTAVGVIFGKGNSFQQAILEVGTLAAKGKIFFDDVIALFNRSENAGLIAYSLTGHLLDNGISYKQQQTELAIAKWARLLTPESFGHLLGALITEPNKSGMTISGVNYDYNQLKAMQQLTISRLLEWLWNHQKCNSIKPIADQRRYQEAISRMFNRNVGDQQKQAYCNNIHQLDEYMKNKIILNSTKDRNWINKYQTYQGNYLTYREQLSLHLSSWESAKLIITPLKGIINMSTTEWK